MIEGRVVYVIVAREMKKFIRERSRLLSTIARPLIWLFLVGGGMTRLVPVNKEGITYLQFFFPGIIGMTILFSSIFSAISIIWDKEFGYMKEMLVAPVSRTSIVVGKALSGTVVSTIQAFIILLLFPLVGLKLALSQIILALIAGALLAFAISSIGIVIATFYESFESFSVIMNFIVMPMFFLSGAMYPVKDLPVVLGILARMNPLTYGVDALKNIIFPLEKGNMGPDFGLLFDITIILLVSLLFIVLGTLFFRRRA
ncbi:inner membrane transport permease YbhR [bacterium BMS3Bbin06]|nr:inner membrane transport permease YbhR [bacterium BMS3Abin08]GBE33859.1 inner membrane transport permease YbhR [bacterium BMS3Bbin06]HDH01107.1 ABC transporter [Nitrospirota bacterium]HDO35579.1 ABC transporter [Nitrospirota bacterium]HDY71766.1 ABC transporter [Nitrospirota bacterium]